MKRFLVLLAVVVAIGIFPAAASAEYHHDNGVHHSQTWKDGHHREWRDHEREWKEHDREWKEHRGDRRWREEHAREWGDWYRWHREHADMLHLHVDGDNFELDIDV